MINIFSPAAFATGGTEALQQLCREFLDIGADARIVYPSSNGNPVPERFKKYNCPWTILDEAHLDGNSISIVPEIWTYSATQLPGLKMIWWLSVDNACLNGIDKVIDNKSIVHLYQSEYARLFLLNELHIDESFVIQLIDKLNDIFYESFEPVEKEDIVLYNPAKVKDIDDIISALDWYTWKSIQNMSPEQIRDEMRKAKVLFNFANDPGHDRMPREAAMQNCIVITSKQGGFANDIDTPTPFKTDSRDKAMRMIQDCAENYDELIKWQNGYKFNVNSEPSVFRYCVERIVRWLNEILNNNSDS